MQAAPHIETVDEPPESPRESKRMTDAEIEIVDEIPEEAPFDPVSLGAARRRTAGAGTALGACLHGWLGAIRGAALGGSCGLGLSLILTLFLAENTEPFNPAYALPFYAFLWISWLVIGMTIGAWRASRWALRRTWLKLDQGTSRIHPNKRCQRRKMHLLLVSPLMLAMLLLTLPFELTASAQVREILRRCQLFAKAWFFHDNTITRFYCARAGVERTEADRRGPVHISPRKAPHLCLSAPPVLTSDALDDGAWAATIEQVAAGDKKAARGSVRDPGSMKFIHIPKTGGTSVENGCSPSRCVFQAYNGKPKNLYGRGWLSPWHFPPDLYAAYYKDDFFHNSSTFCVTRDPADRFASEQAWERRSGIRAWNKTTASELRARFARFDAH